ncbi:MAG: sn-glycerol 3-phosphate transport system permease protein [Thermotogota bacterium]|nr:sn-glycerol 3-phosphate transport system permease protein [Thermotogota bacterium]MDK2864701.1 sn-glycerol 3-phosphate transport system permease protein [Thermotogota bacterium]HCZ06384.1 sugar ABC transporter permease [Thermotogota bacterium]
MSRKIAPYLLLIPTFLVIGLFIYWPAVYSFNLSFHRRTPFGNRMIFVGWKNFIRLFEWSEYTNTVVVTVSYVALSVSITVILSLLLAMLLNQKIPGVRLYRTFIFAPYAISPAIAGVLWSFLLNPVVGHVNYFLTKTFGLQVEWLTTKPYAFYSIVFATVWKMMPFDVIFYLAGLQSIPDELLESSIIDGASLWKRIRHIIVPLLSPITFYLVIMNIITTMFAAFAIIDVMTKGGPANSTTTMIYRLYLDAFAFQKTGIAAAESVVLFLIMSVVTIFYFLLVEKRVHYQ